MKLPNGHDHSCDPARIGCVYWCELGGLLKPLRECVDALDRNLAKRHPDRPVVERARAALKVWER